MFRIMVKMITKMTTNMVNKNNTRCRQVKDWSINGSAGPQSLIWRHIVLFLFTMLVDILVIILTIILNIYSQSMEPVMFSIVIYGVAKSEIVWLRATRSLTIFLSRRYMLVYWVGSRRTSPGQPYSFSASWYLEETELMRNVPLRRATLLIQF